MPRTSRSPRKSRTQLDTGGSPSGEGGSDNVDSAGERADATRQGDGGRGGDLMAVVEAFENAKSWSSES
jgi:hypothetical protein